MAQADSQWHQALTPTPREAMRERVYMIGSALALVLVSAALGVVSSVPGLVVQAIRDALTR
ncbi:MAG: hypothetical protein HPY44_11995 [Armatimonadetes bacterium]|nr:hypothetical protein [Armatimonadota bacterium]